MAVDFEGNEIAPIDSDLRKQHIMQLQKYLREIAKNDNRIPLLAIDGLYLDRTADAVTAFQEIYALPQSGEVDEQTWNKIYEEYIEIVGLDRTCICVDVFANPDATLKQGDNGYLIYFVQVMLLRISDKYNNFPSIEVNGTVDENTEKALKEIRRVSGLDENAGDDDTLRELASIYCSISKI